MIIFKASEEEFINYIKSNKLKIVLFGAGTVCKTYIPYLIMKYELDVCNILFVVDNNPDKYGKSFYFGEREINIVSPCAIENCKDLFGILITNGDFYSVIEQLNGIEKLRNIPCFLASVINLSKRHDNSYDIFKDYQQPVIPKKIHYCWFSGNPIPNILEECIKSWHEKCPDYEIIRWDESNYDVNKHRYTAEAHKLGKWGFIPDIARLEILYEQGGFYFDTDVKILKSLDSLRYQDAFCGRERMGHVNFGGGAACIKNSPIVKKILDFRIDVPFIFDDGTINNEASGYYETKPLMDLGLVIEDVNQKIDGINVYASNFFSPYNYINGEDIQDSNTFSIHFFNGSWIEGGEARRKETREKYYSVQEGLKELL